MALLFMDSFDHYATVGLLDKWTSSAATGVAATVTIGATAGRRSSGAFVYTSGTASGFISGYISRVVSPADATVILGFALNVSAASAATNGTGVATIRDSGGGVQLTLRLNSDQTLSVLRGLQSAGTVLGTTASAVPTGAFCYIEMRSLIADAGGTVIIRINGAMQLNLTGQDTKNTATAGWSSVLLGMWDAAAGNTNVSPGRTFAFDDLYLCDGSGASPWNDFLGDCRVDARFPTAAGATTGWTPLSGANWDAVNDSAPDGDTTYTAAATVGLTDTYVTQDAPVVGATIYGVQSCLSMKKTDSGACTVVPVVRHSGTDFPGTGINPGTTYAYGLQIAATNPGTGAAWTEAGFNAAEFGYQRTV